MKADKNKGTGWIKLYRSSFENELYSEESFTRFQAWVDLLLLANHKDNFFMKRGTVVKVPRGTVGYSMKELAKRWKWSINKVSRFIKTLESEHINQVKSQKTNITTLISILNYEKYQLGESANENSNENQTNTQTETNKNVKNDKEDNNNKKNNAVSNSEFYTIQNTNGLVRRVLAPPSPPPDVILPDKMFFANDFEGLPQQNVEGIVKIISVLKQVTVAEDQVRDLWEVFKLQELTGVKLYRNKEDVYRHFSNWIQKKSFLKTGRSNNLPKKFESNLRPFAGEIRGLKFSEDFTLCEMEDGSMVKLDRNKRDMAESGMIKPKEIIKLDKK